MSVFDPGARLERVPYDGPPLRPRALVPSWLNFYGHNEMTWSIWWSFTRHPFKRGILGQAHNHHGVPATTQRCRTCGQRTWWVPALNATVYAFNQDCLADQCPSYDPHRDVSFLLAPDDEGPAT